ncbi:MAG: DUF2877 domain-containing protein, partial [Nonomuraea sp.]|nr:DUF2877 domain-containing protein [Nonomuraea sp.]
AALPGSLLRPFTTALRQELADHPGRTTLLSATTLTHASDGRVRASILDVLHQLPGGAIDAAAARVLAIGHTSGTDLLSGLVTALHLEQQLRGSL